MVQPLICWFKRRIRSPAVMLPELSIVSWILARNVLTLRFDGLIKHLAVAIAPDRLAQEIEAVLDMRDPGLLVGEFETPLLQEVFHERLDFMFAGGPRDVPVMMKSSA